MTCHVHSAGHRFDLRDLPYDFQHFCAPANGTCGDVLKLCRGLRGSRETPPASLSFREKDATLLRICDQPSKGSWAPAPRKMSRGRRSSHRSGGACGTCPRRHRTTHPNTAVLPPSAVRKVSDKQTARSLTESLENLGTVLWIETESD
jgi:hypothetical protein